MLKKYIKKLIFIPMNKTNDIITTYSSSFFFKFIYNFSYVLFQF